MNEAIKSKTVLNAMFLNQSILNNLSTAILSLDKDLNFCFINQAAESLLDVSLKQVSEKSIFEVLPSFKNIENILLDALQSNQFYTQRRAQFELHNSQVITVDLSVSPVFEEQQYNLLVELTPLDRYLKINREEAFREQQEVTRQMIRGLAHEIKNPLGGIRGSAQLLQSELPTQELREYTSIIIEETDRLKALVDKLLGPNVPSKMQLTNIHEILEKVRRLIEIEGGPQLTFVRDYDPSIPEIYLDPDLMLQAVLNITRNAMQSLAVTTHPEITFITRTDRQFTIASIRHKNVLRIDIIDNGPGILPELREHLFFPMITGRPEGSGLGLSVAQSIIHRHQGIIEAESETGLTRFTLILPLEVAKP